MCLRISSLSLASNQESTPQVRDQNSSPDPFPYAALLGGNCNGIPGPNGAPIKIPCACPPSRAAFISSLNANVNAGHAVHNPSVPVSFPTGSGSGDEVARIQASIITLQNFNGPGQGCPAASTTFSAQLASAIKVCVPACARHEMG
jgi:hypothetical protein